MNMTTKSKVQIVELSAATRDPIVRRRELCISKLQDQAKLIADPNYVRILTRWSGKGAERKSTEKQLTVRSWWVQQLNGVSMRLRFLPGRQGIVVGSMAELPGAIDDVVEQIKSGELDQMITPAKMEPKHPTAAGKNAKPAGTPIDAKKARLSVVGKKKSA
jgi:hypothetical protein